MQMLACYASLFLSYACVGLDLPAVALALSIKAVHFDSWNIF